ncbi:MAG: vitamin B12-dependent ribonucleotide reductase [Caldiserica bacterium]|nr:vitamin B12-dependent ribonucleotide reductase [Caldisericota bacterium]MDH7561836.1 vitamin B12-dependent ribonucleotide reductase [Caldisericota bacterium]
MEKVQLELSKNARVVLEKRYLKKDPQGKPCETPEDMFWRVARDIASADRLYDEKADIEFLALNFYNLMASLDFLPNSPTLMNAGRELQQLSACFVLPVEDDLSSIFESVKNTALIQQSGGGTGFAFSRLRPKNDVVKSTGGVASGPVSFMRVFNMATEVIKQGGTRRGANMGILHISHPDIEEFINCKNDPQEFNNFNISVALTEDFLKKVEEGTEHELINPRNGEVVRRVPAGDLFNKIVENAWRTGEPGIIFIDRINRDNPTPFLGDIESTNPCGEQPLLPYEACNLGSINLSHMVKEMEHPEIDWERMKRTVHLAVHFLDNVIDRSRFPIPKISEMVKGNRKIGLGVMGWADMLIKLGIPYDSQEALDLAEQVMAFIDREGKEASRELARIRGPFPNFEKSVLNKPGSPPLRNATVSTIAPTGTLSIIAGCSSGIEPLFALIYERNVLDKTRLLEVNPFFEKIAQKMGFYSDELIEKIARRGSIRGMEEVPREVQAIFPTAYDVSPEYHVRMQAAFQRHTDNAVSKTVNFPQSATIEDVRKVFMLAFKEGCKGVTIYRDKSREEQVLSLPAFPSGKEISLEELSQTRHRMARARPKITRGTTERVETPRGRIYVTVNEDDQGICEVFVESRDQEADGLSRLISLALRAGVSPVEIIEQLWRVESREAVFDISQDGTRVLVRSIAQGVALAMGRRIWGPSYTGPYGAHEASLFPPPKTEEDNPRKIMGGVCPECGGILEYSEGCLVCRNCGYSKCG